MAAYRREYLSNHSWMYKWYGKGKRREKMTEIRQKRGARK